TFYTFDPNRKAIQAATFDPNGKTILTVSSDKTTRLRDAITLQLIGRPMRLKDETILEQVVDSTSTEVQSNLRRTDDLIESIEFSPDGKTILTRGYGKTRLWDAASGRSLYDGIRALSMAFRRDGIIVFSPDGKFILTGSADKSARLWDI